MANDHDDGVAAEAKTVSDELKAFYRKTAASVVFTALAATTLLVPFYLFAHVDEQQTTLADVLAWVADWHRTIGSQIDVLAAAPAVAAVVLAIWIANALTSPIDDENAGAKERARHLMLDHVTTAATYVGALTLWMLVPAAGFGTRGTVGALVAGVLALFVSALSPLAHDRPDAHRVAVTELERRKDRLHTKHQSLPTVTISASAPWVKPVRALPWRLPALLATITAVLVIVGISYDGTRASWWRVLLAGVFGGLLEWAWAYLVLLPLTAWSVKRASRGWAYLSGYLPVGALGSLLFLLALLVAVTLRTSSVLPVVVVFVAYLLPPAAWVLARRMNWLHPLKALYVHREVHLIDTAIAAEISILQEAGSIGRRRLEEDVAQLLHEVQELRASALRERRRWWPNRGE